MSDRRLSHNTRFWSNLRSVEITSRECLSEVQSLLTCLSKIALARSFRGREAQEFIDFLNQVLMQSGLDTKLRQRSLRLIHKICEARRIIPSSYVLQEEHIRVGDIQYHGGFADVSDGEYQGRTVAIKHLRMNKADPDRIFKRLCREIIAWKHLSHLNVSPLLGVSISAKSHCFHILTEWMRNGNIMQYTMSNPAANHLKNLELSEVMSGVAYLHDLRIVHADLKGANILVDDMGSARVADFGLMTMTDVIMTFLSEIGGSFGGTGCQMSPELLDPSSFGSNGRPTCESNCYALGLVIYEVLTGLRPFHHVYAVTPIPAIAILRGVHPEKPSRAQYLGFSDTLWGLAQLCWSEMSSSRPTACGLHDHLSSVTHTWNPPPVHLAVVAGSSSIFGLDSSSSFSAYLPALFLYIIDISNYVFLVAQDLAITTLPPYNTAATLVLLNPTSHDVLDALSHAPFVATMVDARASDPSRES
ncbi:kinase-like domain-containing protein [Thelephora terrestris]|uniref:Kinase-like domain-containing protein n=1 Tax=Thelephora terrestris TaxID=56493 RepID=A0A9P6HCA8_9AGAM|nr:kinase-like domain-containing protein [Thelephora terrestris]